jgi:hypothetical protein
VNSAFPSLALTRVPDRVHILLSTAWADRSSVPLMEHASKELYGALKTIVRLLRPTVPEEDVVNFVGRIADGFVPASETEAEEAGAAAPLPKAEPAEHVGAGTAPLSEGTKAEPAEHVGGGTTPLSEGIEVGTRPLSEETKMDHEYRRR